ncbi:hypothetical protein FRC04_000612 [Tulasnella sp. 424]|nr:hypothetical protein FRC04_000612 [Tulasnella sp. 424]
MATIAPNVLNPVVFEVPEPPEEFGQDGGKFYRSYDSFAEEIDEDLVSGLKEQLDGLLVFAGLFAGVNSAFLALTLPLLSADPADDTNALLTQNNAILMQLATGRNDSLPTDVGLPSSSFAPANNVVTVNVLFSLSLTFALISSFLAVLGRQWLVYYRKRSGGGPDRQRWEQLKRYLGADRWRLELILDDILPSLLQIGLIIFCISLIIYLNSLSPIVSKIVGVPMYPTDVRRAARNRQEERRTKFKELFSSIFTDSWLRLLIKAREEEPLESLQIIALRRLICTSEDPATLLSTAANILTISDPNQLTKLWDDGIFKERLLDLYKGSAARTLKFLGRGRVDLASAVRRLYAAATTHFVFYINLDGLEFQSLLYCLRDTEGFRESTIWIPEEMPKDTSQFFVQMSLTLSVISIIDFMPSDVEIQNFCGYLSTCSDALINPNWRFLSLICWIVSQLPRVQDINHGDLESMRKVVTGDTITSLESIDRAFSIISEGKSVHTLESDRVMINLMRCTSQVVADECPHPDLRLDQILKILQHAERFLRSASCSREVRIIVEKIRKDTVRKFMRICFTTPQPGRKVADISEDVFEALIYLFMSLRDPRKTRFTYSEDTEALRVFTPLVKEILSDTITWRWEDEFHADRFDRCPVTLRQMLDGVGGSWDEFRLDVEQMGAIQRTENNLRRIRDPESRWCHWQERPRGGY